MASGKNHDAAIVWTCPAIPILCYYLLSDVWLSMLSGISYVIGGLLLSPDLDLPHSTPSRRWGKLKFIWFIYSTIPHRHFLSHGVVVGSLGRIIYLNLWVLPVWVLLLRNPDFRSVIGSEMMVKSSLLFFISVESSAWNHLFLDGLLVPLPKSVKNLLAGNKRHRC